MTDGTAARDIHNQQTKILTASTDSVDLCPDCRGRGTIWRSNTLALIQEYCECEIGVRLKAEQQQRVAGLRLKDSGIPKRFTDYTFDSSPVAARYPRLEMMFRTPMQSWYLWGDYGVGKTGLAVAMGNQLIMTGRGVIFVTVPNMMERIRAGYSAEDETVWGIVRAYSECDVLILDDLGREKLSGFVEEKLYQIIGNRHDEQRDTIFTSNLDIRQTGARIGPATTWRIVEMCGEENIIHVEGRNLRGGD